MKRILGIDYGIKRTGIAISDPLGIIASPLETVNTVNLIDYLLRLIENEKISDLVIGLPLNSKNKLFDIEKEIKKLVDFERNTQLNQYSKIYFNKVKKNIGFNE